MDRIFPFKAEKEFLVQTVWPYQWKALYGFTSTGAHFLDFNNIRLEPEDRPEDLYQRLLSFIDDNLLTASGNIRHHGEDVTTDKELTPSLENVIVLTWLRLIHADLPALGKLQGRTAGHFVRSMCQI